jgi:septal ring factor EnvC (AmiA/AmiB activator)
VRRALLTLAVLLTALASGGGAATPDALAAAEARLAAAGEALAAARGAPAQADAVDGAVVAAIGSYEAALAGLRGVVIDAAGWERELALTLATRREAIMRLAATLQAMGRMPPPPPALHPEGPLAAARASGALGQATPALAAEAEALATTLRALELAREVQRAGMSDLASGLAALEVARDDIARRIPAASPGAAQDAALVAAVRGSDTLTALVAALAGPGTDTAVGQAGGLVRPVQGRILLGFNEPDGGGVRRPGIVVGAPALSLVAAPAAGTVRYAGPFLEFGYVVLLETDAGESGGALVVVLAGLAQLNVATGAAVGQGDLLGLLGGRNLAVEEYVMLPHAETGAGALETLYIELRHGRGPVDPEPWFGDENGWKDDR